jgi:murein DD-endopeptidase MepM/ murein hydrolase activator NlpD
LENTLKWCHKKRNYCFFNIFQTLSQHSMKKKFYASLCLGMSLTVTAMPSFAKAPLPTTKKQVSSSAKPAKAAVVGKKTEPKKSPVVATKAKSGSATGKNHPVAESKDSKHDKKLADSKDSKHGKNKNHQLVDAKDNKHGKNKLHQLADAHIKKHGRRKSSQVEEDENSTEEEETASADTAIDEETPVSEGEVIVERDKPNYPAPVQPIDKSPSQALISAPAKANGLIFQDNRKNEQDPASRIHSSIGGNGNNFIDNSGNHEINARITSAHAVVGGSLTVAGESVGLSNDMIIELTDIFAWDIDFANNLQANDQFTIIYEQTENGSPASNRIIAAQFVNQGKTYTAFRYKNSEGIVGYYNRDADSMRKTFLSAPIDVIRVSSPFSTHRRHPILNRIRAHKGVDYSARTGTPVKSAGDGVITFHGTQGGYGRMIVIAHGEHYETAYAHLSDFRDGLQDGEAVKQGDVIGYVGQSGLATGPHLHYEFRVDGVHRDPEELNSKQAMRLANEELKDYYAQTIPMLAQLTQARAKTLVAKNP